MAGGQAVVVYRNDMIRELQLIELGQGMESVGPSDLDPVAKDLRAPTSNGSATSSPATSDCSTRRARRYNRRPGPADRLRR